MKWKSKIVTGAILLLVGINLFLIMKENSQVERSLFVQQWVRAVQQDLQETLVTDGVSVPLEEQHVYYDENKGSFEGFVVQEGDNVMAGTELFYYSTDSYTDAVNALRSERDRVARQLEGLEEKRTNLGSLLTSSSMTMFEDPFLGSMVDPDPSTDPSVEIDLYSTEAEISKLEGELAMYDERIAAIDEKLPYLHEISDMDGIVKNMNEDLSNPIITLASNEPKVVGSVSEKEQAKLKPGLDVSIYLKNGNKAYEGTIGKVSAIPEDEPNVDKESTYSFEAILTQPVGDLMHGTHVDVKIVTHEVLNAVTVPKQSLRKSGLYVLREGKIEKREVQKGLQVNQAVEIETGLQAGEVVTRKPIRFAEETASFYTPLDVKRWEKDMYEEFRKKEMLKLIGKGFFAEQGL
ncbi:hypothetical protein R4Z10_19845 [Niallia sp. XMNu-256]|uniref:efflux RND transporter periplasmic adaptor subunit n=1 Tax=Niallia sp. XMNu-256 TaxID=3082444 RepID=UPI0030D1C375